MVKVTIKTPKLSVLKSKKDKVSRLKQFFEAAAKIVVADLGNRIRKQVDINGSPLPRNAPETLERKRKLGLGEKSLIAERKTLINPASYEIRASDRKAEIELVEGVPRGGYWWHNTKYKWFGVSKTALKDIIRTLLVYLKKRG